MTAAVVAGAEAGKEAERRPWLSSTRSRVAAIGGVVLLAVAGVLYLTWQPDYGNERKTSSALATSRERPRPLTLAEVEGANLLTVLQQRELSLGRNTIAIRLDADQCARLGVCDPAGVRYEFRLSDKGTLSKAVNDTLKDPCKSGFGFVVENEDGRHVLRASAAGFVARIDTADIDAGLDDVLHHERKESAHSPEQLLKQGGRRNPSLALPYRAKTPWSLEEQRGTEVLELRAVETGNRSLFAQQ